MKFLYYILPILCFTVFDIIGYYLILTKKETVKTKTGALVLYRILQGAFQFAIAYFLYIYDLIFAITFMLSWWFGLCDLLYYVLRGVIPKFDDMFWLWWTPYGIVLKILGTKINYKFLWYFSILSIGISILIIYFL